jgi:anti-sigma regulatory factor (Ser/Thr protein kinase)
MLIDMADKMAIQVKNSFEEIPAANDAASNWLAVRDAPPAIDYLANLAIEELVTNCIKYGYDDADEHTISIELELVGKELKLTVIDDGHPFNPLDCAPPDTSLALEERPVGGLGLHLLRKMSDRMEYDRVQDKNKVTIWKRFPL